MSKKSIIFGVIVLVVLVASSLVKSFIQFSKQEKEQSYFSSHLNAYLNSSYTQAEKNSPYIRGKVVIVDIDKRNIDYLVHPKLPDSIRAQKPDEVETIVLVTWRKQKEGEYKEVETGSVTGDAYRSMAHIRLIDWVSKEILVEKDFFGEDPVGGLTREGDFTSQWPMFKIVEYLESLPRKN